MVQRSVVVVLASLLLIGACAEEDAKTPRPPPKIAVTSVGNPVGPPATATIGAGGGTLTSADGELTLTVPAGAVAADTVFTATAVEATGPGALRAYRLEPEGTQFTAPATIAMKYAAPDLEGSDANALSIGYQDAKRQWRQATTADDATQRRMTTTTSHLSDWSLLRGFVLRPSTATVKVRQSIPLEVKYCDFSKAPLDDEELAPIAYECDDDTAPFVSNVAVEGVVGGNAAVGTVTTGPSFAYTAPGKKPTPNPVTVSVERPNGPRGKMILLSQITVTDDDPAALPSVYTGTLQFKVSSGGPGTQSSARTIEGNGTVTFNAVPGSTGSYEGKGNFTMTLGSAELLQCDCTATGAAELKAGLSVTASGTYGWTVAVEIPNTPLSCTKRNPNTQCVTTQTWLANFSSTDTDPACAGTSSTTYTTASVLAGSTDRTCTLSGGAVNRRENASWSFAGAQ